MAVAGSGTNRVMTSPDGITWTARTAAEANTWRSVTYGNEQFIAVSEDGTNRVMTSPDGVTWTPQAALGDSKWMGVAYGSGQFVAVARDGAPRVMTSDASNCPSIKDTFTLLSCSDGQIVRYNSSSSDWECANPATVDTLPSLSCGADEVAKWNGSAWACAPDGVSGGAITVTSENYNLTFTNGTSQIADADTGGTLGPLLPLGTVFEIQGTASNDGVYTVQTVNNTDTVTVAESVTDETNVAATIVKTNLTVTVAGTLSTLTCADGQIATYNASSEEWECGNINASDSLGGLSCTSGQIAAWNGTAWACADDQNDGSDAPGGGFENVSENYNLTFTNGTSQITDVDTNGTLGAFVASGALFNITGTASNNGGFQTATVVNADTISVSQSVTNETSVAATITKQSVIIPEPGTLSSLNCTNGQVPTWNGGGSEWECGAGASDTLSSISCSNGEIAKWNGTAWACAADADDDTLAGLSCSNGEVAEFDGTNWVCGDGGVAGETVCNGMTWTAQTATEANLWNSVTYGGGQFVAVSYDGTNRVMTSPDGITWTARAAAEANGWMSVAYGNSTFVAVSYDGTNRVMTSPDGVTWTARAAAEANGWVSVIYANSQFVAVAQTGTNRVMTSPDGITWTARTAAEANQWNSVTYGGGQFVAVSATGTNRVMTSSDGITWAARTATEANYWNSVTYGGGQFVAVSTNGTNRVMTSPDGITWTARTAAEVNAWFSVAYGGGEFVAVSSNGTNRVMTSPDGITWTAQAATEANQWRFVTYANGILVALSQNGTNRVMTSPVSICTTTVNTFDDLSCSAGQVAKYNGTTWECAADDDTDTLADLSCSNGEVAEWNGSAWICAPAIDINNQYSCSGTTWAGHGVPESNAWSGITHGNGQYVAVSEDGTNRAMTSPDGETWTAQNVPIGTLPSYTEMQDVAYGNGIYVGIARNGGSTDRIRRSTDGVTWTSPSFPSSAINSITYGNGLFVGLKTSGALFTSPDGITWTERTFPVDATATAFQDITYGNGLFVAVSSTNFANNIVISSDGINWTANSGTTYGQYAVTYGEGKFVTVGFSYAASSTDGINWTDHSSLSNNNWRDVAYGGGLFVATGNGGNGSYLAISEDGETWIDQAPTENTTWSAITYADGKFVAVSPTATNPVMTSICTTVVNTLNDLSCANGEVAEFNGTTWVCATASAPAQSCTPNTTVVANTNPAGAWRSVAYGSGKYVAITDNSDNLIMTSVDGESWSTASVPDGNYTDITYAGGLFVAVSRFGPTFVITSPDGITWTARTAAENNAWRAITFGGGMYVAVASGGTNRVMTSPDGITWTARAAAEANQWFSVTYGNGLFVAGAFDGTNRVMTSPDGITWTARAAGTPVFWDMAFGENIYVAVGGGGTIKTSPDGITWTARTSGITADIEGVAYGSGMFVAVAKSGGGNRVTTSEDGITWTPLTYTSPIKEIAFANGRFVMLDDSVNGAYFDAQTCVPTILGHLSCSADQSPEWNGTTWICSVIAADNLGNHIATQALDMDSNNITNIGTLTSTVHMHSSDRRLKTEIKDINNPFDLLNAIHGKHYLWKKDNVPAFGIIAQDAETVMPEAVSTNPATDMKAVEYDQLVAPLIEAVKVLKAQNEALRDRLMHLELLEQQEHEK